MPVHLDLREDLLYEAVFPNDEGRTFDSQHGFSVHALLFEYAVILEGLLLRIREQRRIQVVLVAELSLPPDAIRADANDNSIPFVELIKRVPEPGRFARSARRVGFWEKVEHHGFLAGIVAQADIVAVVILQGEWRRFAALLQHINLHVYRDSTKAKCPKAAISWCPALLPSPRTCDYPVDEANDTETSDPECHPESRICELGTVHVWLLDRPIGESLIAFTKIYITRSALHAVAINTAHHIHGQFETNKNLVSRPITV